MTLQRKPEWSLQKHVHQFLNAVVLEPREIRGFDKAGAARSVQAWSAGKARGIADGSADHLIVQGDPVRVLWIECKRPDGKGAIRPAQEATAASYAACGVPTVFASSIEEVLDGLRAAGFRLSANADVVARVYQAHVAASERTRAAAAPVKKRSAAAPRKHTKAQVRRGAGIYARLLP